MAEASDKRPVSGAACKAAFNTGKIQGSQGARPQQNPWWNATDYAQRRYMGAWESGRAQGAESYVQTAMVL